MAKAGPKKKKPADRSTGRSTSRSTSRSTKWSPIARARPGARPETDPTVALSNATPIYVQLILLFRQRIERGSWPVGGKIPVLEDLAANFKVARATVRQALNFLEREGLIARSRGSGTFVLRKPQGQLWMDVPNSWKAIVEASQKVVADWSELSAPLWIPDMAEIKNATLAPKYHVIRRVITRAGVPYLIGTSYLDQRLIDELGISRLHQMSVLQYVDESTRFKVAGGTQTIHIDTTDAEISYLLRVPLNAPIVIVRRTVYDKHSILIYQSEGLFRGDFIHVTRSLPLRRAHPAPAAAP